MHSYVMYTALVTLAVFSLHVGPLVILANVVWLLCRPFGDHSHVWLCYVGPYMNIAVFG